MCSRRSTRCRFAPPVPPSIPNAWQFQISYLIPEGTEASSGDRLVSFDPFELVTELETAQSKVESAAAEIRRQTSLAMMRRRDEKLELTKQKAKLEKLALKVDQPEDLVSLNDLKAHRIDHAIAVLQVAHEQARIALSERADQETLSDLRSERAYIEGRIAMLKANIARMVVVASRSGTVVYPREPHGEKLKAGDSVWRRRTVLEIVSLQDMRGAGTVAEIDASRLEVGLPVTLRVDAYPDTQLTGQLDRLGAGFTPKSSTDPSKVMRVKLKISDRRQLPLRPGMRFNGEIEFARIVDTIVVPSASVFVSAGDPFVYRKDGKSFERTSVTVGERSLDEIQITGGLEAGDEISVTVPDMR